jgi:hypothetical protein
MAAADVEMVGRYAVADTSLSRGSISLMDDMAWVVDAPSLYWLISAAAVANLHGYGGLLNRVCRIVGDPTALRRPHCIQ